LASKGDLAGAQSLAKRASTFPVQWNSNEQTPAQLLRILDPGSPTADRRNLAPGYGLQREANAPANSRNVSPYTAESYAAEAPANAVPEGPSTEEMSRWTTLQKQRYVSALLSAARQDIHEGRTDAARQKCLAAQRVEVAYGLFDDRPAHVLAEIARMENANGRSQEMVAETGVRESAPAGNSGATIRAQNTTPTGKMRDSKVTPTSFDTPVSAVNAQSGRQEALRLMREPREDLETSRFDEARVKALKADEFDVAWGVFEERPRHLLAEIERKTGTRTFARGSSRDARNTKQSAEMAAVETAPAGADRQNRTKAVDLLRQARRDIENRQYASARAKTSQAAKLQVNFGPFEDNPDVVLADIDRLENVPSLAQSKASSEVRQVSIPGAERRCVFKSLRHSRECSGVVAAGTRRSACRPNR
jgi:hypothetical protein